jgi:hypothetical protein
MKRRLVWLVPAAGFILFLARKARPEGDVADNENALGNSAKGLVSSAHASAPSTAERKDNG